MFHKYFDQYFVARVLSKNLTALSLSHTYAATKHSKYMWYEIFVREEWKEQNHQKVWSEREFIHFFCFVIVVRSFNFSF